MPAVLGSWKEIANYLGKGVRTVQRWERYSGLPVHRPSGSRKGVVLAFPQELDRWARNNDFPEKGHPNKASLNRNTMLSRQLVEQTRRLHEHTLQLLTHCNQFMEFSRRRQGREQRRLKLVKPLRPDVPQAS